MFEKTKKTHFLAFLLSFLFLCNCISSTTSSVKYSLDVNVCDGGAYSGMCNDGHINSNELPILFVIPEKQTNEENVSAEDLGFELSFSQDGREVVCNSCRFTPRRAGGRMLSGWDGGEIKQMGFKQGHITVIVKITRRGFINYSTKATYGVIFDG